MSQEVLSYHNQAKPEEVEMADLASGEGVRAEDRGAVGGKAKRLSPRQRHRRQSLARNKKKQWGAEWRLNL